MKFVRNGWRRKSFFRQARASDDDAIRDLAKRLVLMVESHIYLRLMSSLMIKYDSNNTPSSDGGWRLKPVYRRRDPRHNAGCPRMNVHR
jgi:hypothetical protein